MVLIETNSAKDLVAILSETEAYQVVAGYRLCAAYNLENTLWMEFVSGIKEAGASEASRHPC